MYNFTETKAVPTYQNESMLKTVFNSFNLDDELTDSNGRFVTKYVNGRSILNRRISEFEMPGVHGAREGKLTYDSRVITIGFLLEAKSNELFMVKVNKLNGFLLGQKNKLSFTDENAFFYATLSSGDFGDEDSNSVEGTLVFVCNDSAKYKELKTISIDTPDYHDIKTQSNVMWETKTVFTSNASNFLFEAENMGVIELNFSFIPGDVLELDYLKRKAFLNGDDITSSISLHTSWFKLAKGMQKLSASEETKLKYYKTYY